MTLPVKNGDIIICYEEEIDRYEPYLDPSANEPDHVMVLGRLESKDERYYLHAAAAVLEKDEEGTINGVRASSFEELSNNSMLVLRINNPELLGNFVKVVEGYAKRVKEQITDKTPLRDLNEMKHQERPYKFLQTPLGTVRNVKEKENLEAWGLFRNIRAYLRFMEIEKTGIPKPLSKNWGVECAQFVSYCFLIANIMTAFPNGLPEAIVKNMQEIELARKDPNRADEVTPLLEKLYDGFKSELEKVGEEGRLTMLTTQVKSLNITQFTNQALGIKDDDAPQIFDVQPIGLLQVSENPDGSSHLSIDVFPGYSDNQVIQDESPTQNLSSDSVSQNVDKQHDIKDELLSMTQHKQEDEVKSNTDTNSFEI